MWKHLAAIGIHHLISHIVGYRSSLYIYIYVYIYYYYIPINFHYYIPIRNQCQYLIQKNRWIDPIHSPWIDPISHWYPAAKMRVVFPSTTSFSMHLADKLQASSKRSLGIQIPGGRCTKKQGDLQWSKNTISMRYNFTYVTYIQSIYIYIHLQVSIIITNENW